MPKKQSANQQSEPITPKETLAQEPEVKETLDTEKVLEDIKVIAENFPYQSSEEPIERTPAEKLNAMFVSSIDYLSAKGIEPMQFEPKKEIPLIAPLTDEEKILSFLEGKTDFVRINEELKRLYPLPSFQQPAKFLLQTEGKRLKGLLTKLIGEGRLTVKDNRHEQLGKFYYDSDNKQQHHNLNNLVLEARKMINFKN